jgi:CheY-like chemotaxis protein
MAKTILLAEDSPEAATLFKLVLERNSVDNPIVVVTNGHDTIAYLAGQGKYADRIVFPMPEVLFLDLRMPELDGYEVLEWLKGNPSIRKELLIIVLSDDVRADSIRRAYDLGANSFLTKPLRSRDVRNLIQHFAGHWVQPKM